jgi:DNA-binding transcriptional LysR family regulator
VIANSAVVHELVGEGRADFGVAADVERAAGGGPLEQRELCEDEVVVAISPAHRWAAYEEIPLEELLATPMVMRDPSANTRRVVEAALRERGVQLAARSARRLGR